MVHFHNKNPYLGIFWRALEWKMLVYFMPIWNILRSFGIFYGHLKYITALWYTLRKLGTFLHIFGKLYQVKSGNSVQNVCAPGKNREDILFFDKFEMKMGDFFSLRCIWSTTITVQASCFSYELLVCMTGFSSESNEWCLVSY
jgi:hypothetical protein